jgi:hypothetical protein
MTNPTIPTCPAFAAHVAGYNAEQDAVEALERPRMPVMITPVEDDRWLVEGGSLYEGRVVSTWEAACRIAAFAGR